MRIAHVSDSYLPRVGGIELHIRDLAGWQRASGHEVEVITRTAGPGEAIAAGVPVHRAMAPTGWLPTRSLLATRAGLALVRSGGYDLVHVHVSAISPLATAVAAGAARTGVPTVVTVHSLWAYLSPLFGLLDGAVRWSRWPVLWSAVSDLAAQPVRSLVGPGVDVAVLPNGVDSAAWRVTPAPRDPDDVLVVAVMRLAPRKRPLPLVRMLSGARALLPDRVRLRVLIIGDGPQRGAVDRYLRRHRMDDWVTLRGRLDRRQIQEVFRRADLFVAPANLESFGLAALEARSAGLPVIAKRHTGIGALMTDDCGAALVDSDTAMTDAIARIAGDAALRAAMTGHDRLAENAPDWPYVLARHEIAYVRAAEICGRGHPAASARLPTDPIQRAGAVGIDAWVAAAGRADPTGIR